MAATPSSNIMTQIPIAELAPSFEHRRDEVGTLTLHSVVGGPEDGDLVVLLHGFPQFWYTWRKQLEPLADAGYRVIAPDLRGFNESDRPSAVDAYRIEPVLDDIAKLIESQQQDAAIVVGHDLGGIVAWELAMARPTLVSALSVINAPHPAAYKRELTNPSQLRRSSYALFFQLPSIPEWVLSRNDFAILERAYTADPKVEAHYTESDIERYKAALREPGALTAALNYYRAWLRGYGPRVVRETIPGLRVGRPLDTWIEVPTQVIWGMDDPALDPVLTEGLESWIPDVRVERLAGVSHWVPEETPRTTTRLLRNFFEETSQ